MNEEEVIKTAIDVIHIEAKAVAALSKRINHYFIKACQIISLCEGRVIVIGMGKSGHIANKIAATLASTGTPAFFIHPAEASHGDLGMITRQDVVLALSNSGETDEILTLLPLIKRLGVPLIAMTGCSRSSRLATLATVHLDHAVEKEACVLGLAPTSSTTAALVLGDALAVSLMTVRGFTQDDFALSHPGGSLGRRLLVLVSDVMHSGDKLPVVQSSVTVMAALTEMTAKKLGMTTVVNEQKMIVGIFTDGDLRRLLETTVSIQTLMIGEVMIQQCTLVSEGMLAAEAMQLMEVKKINALIVVDKDKRLIGALNMHDLIQAGIV